MRKNRIITFLMTLVLALSIATPAFADDNDKGLTCDTLDFGCKIQDFLLESSMDGLNSILKEMEFIIVTPSSIMENPKIHQYYENAKDFSQILIIVIFIYKMIELLASADPLESRTALKDSLVKLVFTCLLALCFHRFFKFFLVFNNWYVEAMLNDGVSFSKFKLVQSDIDKAIDTSMSLILLSIMGLIALILLVVFLFQTTIRNATLAFYFAIAPIVIATNMASSFNMFPSFWRHLLSTIFTQAVQVTMIVFMANAFADTHIWNMHNMFLAVGYLFLVVKAPSFVQEIMWSSGTGKAVGGIGVNTVATVAKEVIRRRV